MIGLARPRPGETRPSAAGPSRPHQGELAAQLGQARGGRPGRAIASPRPPSGRRARSPAGPGAPGHRGRIRRGPRAPRGASAGRPSLRQPSANVRRIPRSSGSARSSSRSWGTTLSVSHIEQRIWHQSKARSKSSGPSSASAANSARASAHRSRSAWIQTSPSRAVADEGSSCLARSIAVLRLAEPVPADAPRCPGGPSPATSSPDERAGRPAGQAGRTGVRARERTAGMRSRSPIAAPTITPARDAGTSQTLPPSTRPVVPRHLGEGPMTIGPSRTSL